MALSQEPACRDVDPDLHFPLGYGNAFHAQIAEAKDVCRACPLYSTCLDYVLDNPDMAPHGIWAATTPHERRAMREGVVLAEAAARIRESADHERPVPPLADLLAGVQS